MIISLFAVPVLLALVLILFRFNRKAGEKAAVAVPEPSRPAEDVDRPPLAEQWTILDDYQLNRLLRESSS